MGSLKLASEATERKVAQLKSAHLRVDPVVHRERLRSSWAGVLCQTCERPVEAGERVVRHEYLHIYIDSDRHQVYHLDCCPETVDEEWGRLRNQYQKEGWS